MSEQKKAEIETNADAPKGPSEHASEGASGASGAAETTHPAPGLDLGAAGQAARVDAFTRRAEHEAEAHPRESIEEPGATPQDEGATKFVPPAQQLKDFRG